MSLLIKALDKAQAEKAEASKKTESKKTVAKSKATKPSKKKSTKAPETLTLEEPGNGTSSLPQQASKNAEEDVPKALQGTAADPAKKAPVSLAEQAANKPKAAIPLVTTEQTAQAQAANVFTAKNAEPNNRTAKVAWFVGLLALGVMGALAYWYQTVINTPDIVIPPRPAVNQEMPEPLPDVQAANDSPKLDAPIDGESSGLDLAVVELEMVEAAEAGVEQKVQSEVTVVTLPETKNLTGDHVKQTLDQTQQTQETTVFNSVSERRKVEALPSVTETLAENETVVDVDDAMSSANLAGGGAASNDAAFKITPNKVESGVNPVLMRAYEAYNAGNNQQAAEDYKTVLKRYGPNVDAMLGLGAIATRQDRLADANGWYRKVLEVEPRNEVAKAGLLNLQQSQNNQPQTNESNIKSMIATAPNDANLHAALGDLYANQSQWPAAQQAYFDAYRLRQSADNAFNLGVSLDQLGKTVLALPYYREALQKAEQSGAIDVETLKARISSIE